MNRTEWCRANGISDKQFFYWQRILRKETFEASREISVISSTRDIFCLLQVSFKEISFPVKQDPAGNGFHRDAITRKGKTSVVISNFVSAELLSEIGVLLNAEWCIRVPKDLSCYRPHRPETGAGKLRIHHQIQFSTGLGQKRKHWRSHWSKEYSFINDILPWLEKLLEICRNKAKTTNI